MTTFQMLLLGILSSKEPTHYTFSDIDAVTSNFPSFDKYIFPQSKTCLALLLSADCAERSCSSNMVVFNNFLVFNFPFFNFEQ